jgi:hypothetical protein
MPYIITENRNAAAFFTSHLTLKKDMNTHAFELFTGEKAVVCLTDNGACAVSYIAGRYGIKRTNNDGLLYIVGASSENEKIYYPHTIIDGFNRIFYPDMLYRHDFNETVLVNHEAATAYHNATRFWTLGQIIFLQAHESKTADIFSWFMPLTASYKKGLTQEESDSIASISENIRLTFAMKTAFTQWCTEYNGDVLAVLQPFKHIISNSKQERTAIFEALRRSVQL